MGQVIVTFGDGNDSANLAWGNLNSEELQSELDNFSNKHKKIIDLFEGKFFYVDKPTGDENEGFDNSIWLLFPPWEELEISTRDTFRLSKDIPNRDKSILRFFSKIKKEEYYEWNGADPKDKCPYGFGEVGFPDEFYKDLFKLTSKVGVNGRWSIDNAIVSGEKGYYTGYITLTEEGLSERTVYYTGEEDFW